jgi:hypothetical protein
MPIDRAALEAAITASGNAEQHAEQVEGLLTKLEKLEATGRYTSLLKAIARANDKSNFHSLLLEVSFAYQFESCGINLSYEVKQDSADGSSIDFDMKLDDGRVVFFELRLLQQDQTTVKEIAEQLTQDGLYNVSKDGADEQKEILRLQSTVLSKVEDKNGKSIKFFNVDAGGINIVVVCISDILLGTADMHDCILATYGDPAVPDECRRGIFGLFQDVKPEYTAEIQKAASRFAHLKDTVHAVLFLFRPSGSGLLDYPLQQVLLWNHAFAVKEDTKSVVAYISAAISPLA